VKAEYINPFLQATIKVLSTMASITPTPGKPGIKNDEIARGDIIGITGHSEGSMSLTLSRESALAVIKNMDGEEFNEMTDAVGELTNMISGDACPCSKRWDSVSRRPFPLASEEKTTRQNISAAADPLFLFPLQPNPETSGLKQDSLNPHPSVRETEIAPFGSRMNTAIPAT